MNKLCSYCIVVLLGLLTLGCKKDKEEPSKTELLTNKNWIQTAYTVSPGVVVNGATVTDIYAQSQPCDRDDFIRFETPNVFKSDEGATKCTQTDPQTTTGTWTFNGDNTILTVTAQGSTSPQSLNVQELTDSSLRLSYTQAAGTNPVITYTITFRKG